MSKVLVTESYLTDIGNAIRAKNKSTTKYRPSEMAEAISSIVNSFIVGGDPTVVINNGSSWKYSITQKEHENITVNVSSSIVGDNTSGYKTNLIFAPSISTNYGYNAGAIVKAVDEKNHVVHFTTEDAVPIDGLIRDGWAGIYILNSNPNKDSVSYYFNDYNNHSSSRVSEGASIENLLILGYYTEDSNGNLVAKTKSNVASFDPSNTGSLKTYQNKYATDVKYRGFDKCPALTSIDIPNATSIGEYAFQNCSALTSIDLRNAINIGEYAFCNCSALTSIDLPNATSIGGYAFYSCSALTSIDIPNATSIGDGAFEKCSALTSIDLPNATSIGGYAFQKCSALTSIDLRNAINIGEYAFCNCFVLTSIDLPNATSIGNGAFQNCSALTSIDLPNATSIGNGAFQNDYSLKTIFLHSKTMCTCTGGPAIASSATIYVPESLINSYKTATYWSSYASRFKTLESIKLTKISIIGDKNINTYNGNTTSTYKASYNDGLVDPKQVGVTWSITGNATISQDGVVTLKNASVGDQLTITVTSTYNTSISTSLTVSVVNDATSMTVDLNNGQWVDSGTTIDGHTVYKSDAGSYHVNHGTSTCTINVFGYSSVTIYARSYAESDYDYLEVGPLDGTVSRDASSNVLSTKGKQSSTTYLSHTFTIEDNNQHTFQILYSKDGSGDSDEDRGYFYVVCE